MKRLLLSLLFLFQPGQILADSTSLGLGPAKFDNAYPLAISQLTVRPDTPSVLGKPGQFSTKTSYTWSNTYNDDRSLTVDTESKSISQLVTTSLSDKTDISLGTSLHWRGGGSLDDPIEKWHSIFGFPQGGRDKVQSNRYRMRGVNENGSEFSIDEGEIGFGDLQFRAKSIWLEDHASSIQLSSAFTLQAPTGASRYSNEGMEAMAETLIAKKIARWILYSGVGIALSSKDNYQEAKLRRSRPGGFVATEYIVADNSSIGASYLISAHPNAPVKVIPEIEQYLDLFIIYKAWDLGTIEASIRENPSSGNTTSDISFHLSITHNWGEKL